MTEIKKVLVTGSNGTIGTALCESLIESGYQVYGVDRVRNRWSKKVDACTVIADLCDERSLKELPTDVDLVIHLAANARVYLSVLDPNLAKENLLQNFHILEYVRSLPSRRIIFASSREVYGPQDVAQVSEDRAAIHGAESPYTASKTAGEAFVAAYGASYDVESVIVRFSNVYGRYDESERVVPLFIRKCLNGEPMTIFGAEKTYDFTYIDDAVRGVVAIAERFAQVKGEVFNLATGRGTSIGQVAKYLQEVMSVELPIDIKENRRGELMRYVGDISKARELLGYEPQVDVREGMRRAVEWYKSLPR